MSIESGPVQAPPLRPPSQPVAPEPDKPVAKLVECPTVPGQTVIRVVPHQHRGKVPVLLRDWFVPVSFAPERDPVERPGDSTLRCLALDDRIAVS